MSVKVFLSFLFFPFPELFPFSQAASMNMDKISIAIVALVTMVAWNTPAQDHLQESDEKLGTVHFAISCNDSAQTEFNRAIALLHSFQFSRAIAGFESVLRGDATCGIAYWGIALSDWSNPFAPGAKDKGQLQAGRENAERGKTERERAYIAAVGKLYSNYESTPLRIRLISYRDAMGGAAGPSVGFFALAAIPARYALERQDWKQATQLVVRDTPFSYTEAMTWFARGYGAARLGQAEAANESATALQQIKERLSMWPGCPFSGQLGIGSN